MQVFNRKISDFLWNLTNYAYICSSNSKKMNMKRLLFSICLLFSFLSFCYAGTSYYLCKVTTAVNLREGPSTQYNKILKMLRGSSFVVILDDDAEVNKGDFVYGLYIDENIYGYVCETYLDVVKELETDKNGVLSRTGESYGYDPEIEIKNNTSRKITVRVNNTNIPFNPYENLTITCEPGPVSIFASSPGVIPYSATDYVSENSSYSWTFYIKTSYR